MRKLRRLVAVESDANYRRDPGKMRKVDRDPTVVTVKSRGVVSLRLLLGG